MLLPVSLVLPWIQSGALLSPVKITNIISMVLPYTRNTVTNHWDKDATPGTGASGHLATVPPVAPQPQQPVWISLATQGGWTPPPTAPPAAPTGPSAADPKGGIS